MRHSIPVLLGTLIVCFLSCSKDKDNDDDSYLSTDRDTIMREILTEAAVDDYSFMDITPIPLQSELYDFAETDTSLLSIIQAIEDFNDMIQNPGILLGASMKSTQGGWVSKGCESIANVSICTWERSQGTYMYRFEQTIESFSGTVKTEISCSGTRDGIFYGELGEDFYPVSDETIISHNKQIITNIYDAPYNEIVRDQEPYAFTYIFTAGDGLSIIHWGEVEYILNYTYESINYLFDETHGNYPVIHTISEWTGSLLTNTISTYCPSYQGLRVTYNWSYDFDEHEGSWCSYDCDQIPISCGSLK